MVSLAVRLDVLSTTKHGCKLNNSGGDIPTGITERTMNKNLHEQIRKLAAILVVAQKSGDEELIDELQDKIDELQDLIDDESEDDYNSSKVKWG